MFIISDTEMDTETVQVASLRTLVSSP